MTWLAFLFALEVGYMPVGDFVMHDPPGYVCLDESFYVHFDAEVVLFKYGFVGGSIKTFMWKTADSYQFCPERDLYEFKVGLRFDHVELGWRHYCTHPVMPYLNSWLGGAKWEGGYEEVYLRLESK
jgi:hypothetical protein